jgi:hypothetical protein
MAVLLACFDVLPILFSFEKRCAFDSGTWTPYRASVDSLHIDEDLLMSTGSF